MGKPKRAQISPWVMRVISITGGMGVIWLAAHRWYVTAYVLYIACVFAAVAYGASMEGWKEGGGES